MVGDRITEIAGKHKAAFEAWILPLCLILVGLTAFGLGRLSVTEEGAPRLIIRLPDGTVQSAAAYAAQAHEAPQQKEAVSAGGYVASKNGSKYYPPGCGGASRIKEENRVYFASPAQAEAAGYSLAANC